MAGLHGMSGSLVLGGLVFVLVVLFAYPALLMAITRAMVRFRPGYWRCFGVVLLSGIVGGIIGFILSRVFGVQPGTTSLRVVSLVINFILVTLFLRAFVKHPNDAPLDWNRTALSALIYVIIVAVISFAFTAVVHHFQATGALPTPQAMHP